MIALPGLLLETGRYGEALEVLRTFAEAMDDGMIPNRFDDYGRPPHFNRIDASLWFVIAADRYVRASGDQAAWDNELAGAVNRILQAYHDGTRFDIHADSDGLLAGGDAGTQLTWMDVSFAGQPVTPRHGKCVEITALWHAALRIAADRATDPARADEYAALAARVADAFTGTFWNDRAGCLYDCRPTSGWPSSRSSSASCSPRAGCGRSRPSTPATEAATAPAGSHATEPTTRAPSGPGSWGRSSRPT